MRWVFFHGAFGGWGWEQLDQSGLVTAESRRPFESREEAELDAFRHGYTGLALPRTAADNGLVASIKSIAARAAPAPGPG